MIDPDFFTELVSATRVTVLLALSSTLVLILLAPSIAWWLSRSRSRLRSVVEATTALPLVLPPTVIGFYLLLGYSGVGNYSGYSLAFSFSGLVVGSVIYSLPFVIQPLTTAFRAIDNRVLEAAASLGATPRVQFLRVVLPMHRKSLIAAATLGFAHTLGEFGIVLMIGGNIEGETRVLSILLFDQVESLQYQNAHITALMMLFIALVMLSVIYRFQDQPRDD